MSNYRVRKIIAGLVAVLALGGVTVATTAPADAAANGVRASYAANGV